MTVFRAAFIFCATIAIATSAFATEPVRVGSKAFTESVILGELATQLGNNAGVPTIHRGQLVARGCCGKHFWLANRHLSGVHRNDRSGADSRNTRRHSGESSPRCTARNRDHSITRFQ